MQTEQETLDSPQTPPLTGATGRSDVSLRGLVRLLRPHQWVKNAIIVAPLFFTPSAMNLANAVSVLVAVLAFCCISSSIYIVNDYIDREADRQHPKKRLRPLAAGTVTPAQALALFALLLVAAAALGASLPMAFGLMALAYLVNSIAYSFVVKHVAILDVMCIAIGFILRLFAGAMVIDVVPSSWMVVVVGLLALFLALAKRRDDLEIGLNTDHRASLKGYTKEYLDTVITVVLGALLIAYLMFTTGEYAVRKFETEWLYLTTPFVIAGVLRYLQITIIEKRSGSPTRIALQDRFLHGAIAGWVITFGLLIYL